MRKTVRLRGGGVPLDKDAYLITIVLKCVLRAAPMAVDFGAGLCGVPLIAVGERRF
jgi:hypothetical protein